jgi:hypothetical protein
MERRQPFWPGIVVDEVVAGDSMPVIEPISWMNLGRREQRLHDMSLPVPEPSESADQADSKPRNYERLPPFL